MIKEQENEQINMQSHTEKECRLCGSVVQQTQPTSMG